MSALVTGGAGFIGSNLVEELLAGIALNDFTAVFELARREFNLIG